MSIPPVERRNNGMEVPPESRRRGSLPRIGPLVSTLLHFKISSDLKNSFSWFNEESEEVQKRIISVAKKVKLKAEKTLFEEGDLGKSVYLITKGEIGIYIGGKKKTSLSAGRIVGEKSIWDKFRSATAKAEKDSEIIEIPISEYRDLLKTKPLLLMPIIVDLANKLTDSNSKNKAEATIDSKESHLQGSYICKPESYRKYSLPPAPSFHEIHLKHNEKETWKFPAAVESQVDLIYEFANKLLEGKECNPLILQRKFHLFFATQLEGVNFKHLTQLLYAAAVIPELQEYYAALKIICDFYLKTESDPLCDLMYSKAVILHELQRRFPKNQKKVLEDLKEGLHKVEVLKKCSLYQHVPLTAILQIASLLKKNEHNLGAVFFSKGDVAGPVYIIDEGSVMIYEVNKEGKEICHKINEMNFFGELGPVTGQPRSASVRTNTASITYELSPENFKKAVDSHPEILYAIGQKLSESIQKNNEYGKNLDTLVQTENNLRISQIKSSVSLDLRGLNLTSRNHSGLSPRKTVTPASTSARYEKDLLSLRTNGHFQKTDPIQKEVLLDARKQLEKGYKMDEDLAEIIPFLKEVYKKTITWKEEKYPSKPPKQVGEPIRPIPDIALQHTVRTLFPPENKRFNPQFLSINGHRMDKERIYTEVNAFFQDFLGRIYKAGFDCLKKDVEINAEAEQIVSLHKTAQNSRKEEIEILKCPGFTCEELLQIVTFNIWRRADTTIRERSKEHFSDSVRCFQQKNSTQFHIEISSPIDFQVHYFQGYELFVAESGLKRGSVPLATLTYKFTIKPSKDSFTFELSVVDIQPGEDLVKYKEIVKSTLKS